MTKKESVRRLPVVIVLLAAATTLALGQLDETFDPAEEIRRTVTGWRDLVISQISAKMDELNQIPTKLIDFEMIGKIIDATIEEDCEIEPCPDDKVRETNPDYAPVSNGCGSFGLQWRKDLLPDESQEDCCNEHDFCYDKCGADKDLCDLYFKKCLYKACRDHQHSWTPNKLKGCKAAAKLMYTATSTFGCKAYQDAQQLACRCVDPAEEPKEEL